jgi:hypothetical protein
MRIILNLRFQAPWRVPGTQISVLRAVLWIQNNLVRILLFRIVPDPDPNPFYQAN